MKIGRLTWRLVVGSFLQWFGVLLVVLAPLGFVAGVVRLRLAEPEPDPRIPQVTLLALGVGHCAMAVGGALWWRAGCWIRSRQRGGRIILAVVALGYLIQGIAILSGVFGPVDVSSRQRP